jgi:hypothetical protein
MLWEYILLFIIKLFCDSKGTYNNYGDDLIVISQRVIEKLMH